MHSFVTVTVPILSSFGISYIMSSMKSSIIDRKALAPVFLFIALAAISFNASSVNLKSTSSIASNFLYCLIIAFFGSVSIFTSISSVKPSNVNIIGRRPMNSGIIPNFLKSSFITLDNILASLSYLSFKSDIKPIVACLLRRSLIISSNPGNAPPHINNIFFVFTVAKGTIAFLLVAPTGTSTSLPSSNFNNPC